MLTPAKQTGNQAEKATATNGSFFGEGKSAPFFQAKLTVNKPGDEHEREADAVADQVMRMPAFVPSAGKQGDVPIVQRMHFMPVSGVQRACTHCEQEKQKEEEKEGVQRKETGGGDAGGKTAPSVVSEVLSSGGGQPIEGGTRQFMESRFGHDFSQVRIHTDARAAESASAIRARAYTSGRNVVFGSGEYQPGGEGGKRLLAHELVHVEQQGSREANAVQRKVGANNVSCATLPKDPNKYPIYKAMNTTDPLGEIQNADSRAIQLLNDTIGMLQKGIDYAKKSGNAPAFPDFSDCFGSALKSQMLLNPDNPATWTKEGPGTVSHVMNRFIKLKGVFDGGFMQYVCISTDCIRLGNPVAFVWTLQTNYNLKLCSKFWKMGLDDRALTFIHELSHVYFKTEDWGFKGPGSAHCLEQFVAAINFIPVPKEFQDACNYIKMDACKT